MGQLSLLSRTGPQIFILVWAGLAKLAQLGLRVKFWFMQGYLGDGYFALLLRGNQTFAMMKIAISTATYEQIASHSLERRPIDLNTHKLMAAPIGNPHQII